VKIIKSYFESFTQEFLFLSEAGQKAYLFFPNPKIILNIYTSLPADAKALEPAGRPSHLLAVIPYDTGMKAGEDLARIYSGEGRGCVFR
jgi:hypothetical protein